MKRIPIIMAISLCLSLSAQAQAAQAPESPTLAVFDLRTKDIERAVMLQYLDALSGALYRSERVVVIDRARREEVLGEIEFALSDAAADQESIVAGRQLAAALILTGSIGVYDGTRVVNLRLLDTATGKMVGTADELYSSDEDLFAGADIAVLTLLKKASPARRADPARPEKPSAAFASSAADDILEPRGIAYFPVQLSIWAPVQLMPRTTTIVGAKVALCYSDNDAVYGIDTGIVGNVRREMIGVQANVVNIAGRCLGVQTGLIGTVGTMYVLQANAVLNKADELIGAQVGLINVAGKCVGSQVGLVNVAGLLRGIQIGLVNVVRFGEQAGFMPIINMRF